MSNAFSKVRTLLFRLVRSVLLVDASLLNLLDLLRYFQIRRKKIETLGQRSNYEYCLPCL
jgi:hypothetical protein